MLYYISPTSKDIKHHGILGMKWGKKNGPPYPLGLSDHSSSEKKAGWIQSLKKRSIENKEAKNYNYKKDNAYKNLTRAQKVKRTQAYNTTALFLGSKIANRIEYNVDKKNSNRKKEILKGTALNIAYGSLPFIPIISLSYIDKGKRWLNVGNNVAAMAGKAAGLNTVNGGFKLFPASALNESIKRGKSVIIRNMMDPKARKVYEAGMRAINK